VTVLFFLYTCGIVSVAFIDIEFRFRYPDSSVLIHGAYYFYCLVD
jgi:hypothetical protein